MQRYELAVDIAVAVAHRAPPSGWNSVSKRLGHADASITLKTYAHLVGNEDTVAACVADMILAV